MTTTIIITTIVITKRVNSEIIRMRRIMVEINVLQQV